MKLSTFFANLLVLIIVSSFNIYAQTPLFSTAAQGGGTLKDIPHSLAVDPDGNIYMTGEFTGTGSFSPLSFVSKGNVDFCLIKYDSTGKALWGVSGGGTLTDRGYGVALDNEGYVYTTGELFGSAIFGTDTITSAGNLDCFLFKFDANGNYIWKKRGASVSQVATRGIAVDQNNNIYITGYFGSATVDSVRFDDVKVTTNGARDIFVAKYSNTGSVLWAKNFGGLNSGDEGRGINVDATGNVYLTGVITGTATFGSFTLNGYNLTSTDMFVAKLTSDGDVVWAKMAGEAKADEGSAIKTDLLGNVYVSGRIDSAGTFGSTTIITKGGYDAYIAKYTASGDFVDVKTAGGIGQDYCNDLAVDKDNNLYGFGNFAGTAFFGTDSLVSAGTDDIFLVKFSADGSSDELTKISGTAVDKSFAMAVDYGGNIYLTGTFTGSLDLGDSLFVSAGAEDIFVGRLGNNPVPVELSFFSASINGKDVILSWETTTEVNNSGFQIERSLDKISYKTLGFVKGNGSTSERCKYSFVDTDPEVSSYYYRLKQMDLDGTFEYSNIIEVNLEVPASYSLSQNYPNPFNPSTEISFSVPVDASVTLAVYNSIGEKVLESINSFTAGTYLHTIDGSNLTSGIYFYTIKAVGNNGSLFNSTKKMVLIK